MEKSKAELKVSIWKAIAQSGVPFNNLSNEDQSRFVDQLTETLYPMLFSETENIQSVDPVPESDDELEEVLWHGRPFLSLVESYTITNERIKIVRGLISKDIENFELIRVQDLDVSQSVGDRLIGIGDITISGADASSPMIILRNVPQPHDVYELLRKAWLAARKKYGLIFREEM
ncbi:MAG: PH domain-containing protein [Anaerolineaceae bacterium]|nr:PH domain-containing protein [Anaerolineaceae bacterium]